ncbi:protein-export chaperone SecB [Hydrocarboniclastica marina]|uniref:Protein-export protein SecB n=1 Tax=Hydrocarboniclastica marina TaxID=2259620 RepID=A0A4P7XJW3_9ALTE|nr:protein-export chaperone SecB [Hydrocarboniclastica marina]MAL99161.1 protein-export chaperone SecB [Alteromonadaceae bacterium]QCF26844.1 protein-export chaperone SecB [Hydrocarboniclastica marina]|tara:strand:+ start:456 stop:962 length:507 start_codon:yes stop_codon:yes gene_type:complete
MAENTDATAQQNDDTKPQFALQRIYVKDISFESPNAPAIFQQTWQPKVSMDLNSSYTKISDTQYEVVVSLSITAKIEEKVAYIVEVQQAGVVMIKNIEDAQLGHMLGAYCPNLLFPYARETVDGMVNRGSFPSLMLAPVNFDLVYQQSLQRKQQEQAEQGAAEEKQPH